MEVSVASNNGDEPDTVSKPIGPFEDFDACVTHFEGDPDVEDPEALCGFLEQNKEALEGWSPEEDAVEDLVEALNDPQAEKVLQNLTVTHVSGVDNPAQDSAWVMAKDTDARGADWGVTSPLVLKKGHTLSRSKATPPGVDEEDEDAEDSDDADEEEQKAWAPVLIPNETDKQGDVIPPNEIEKAAHQFLANFRNIDTDHDLMGGKGVPIESWTLKQDTSFTLPGGDETREYPEGTWMMGVQFGDETWTRIKAGEITGFSIYGEAENIPVSDIIGGSGPIQRSATIELSKDSGETVHGDLSPIFEAIEKAAEEMEVEPERVLASMLKRAWPEDAVDSLTESEDADTGTTSQHEQTMSESETETEETEEESKEAGEGEETETPDVAETLKSIKSTVEDNNDTIKSVRKDHEDLEERVSDLEESVKDADGGEETEEEAETSKEESTEEEETETSKEETEGSGEEDAGKAAEEAVKNVLGIEDLPEDEEERKAVVRKALAEPGEETGEELGPIALDEADLEGVM